MLEKIPEKAVVTTGFLTYYIPARLRLSIEAAEK